jgi:hypothetical protein
MFNAYSWTIPSALKLKSTSSNALQMWIKQEDGIGIKSNLPFDKESDEKHFSKFSTYVLPMFILFACCLLLANWFLPNVVRKYRHRLLHSFARFTHRLLGT